MLTQTYNVDAQVADSAGTATAFMSGVKTKYGVVGVDQRVTRGNCSSMIGAEVESILDWSLREGIVFSTIFFKNGSFQPFLQT